MFFKKSLEVKKGISSKKLEIKFMDKLVQLSLTAQRRKKKAR
jgi:hypothetical protein